MKESKLYTFSLPIIKIFVKIILRPKIINKEYITDEKLILAGTHTHDLDCLLLMASTKRHVHFLAKKELFEGKFKFIFKNMDLIPVDRKIKDKSVIPAAEKYLKQNKLIGIFPEGTYSKKHELLPFKIGTIKIAHDTNTKIVPFVIKGQYFKKGLKIIYGEPFKVESDNLEEENKKFRDKIIKMLEEN
ncbi:MAG: 1-acyl-sn-glycerol-3-phosphate acyltransferase [Bacilli bacterium]|nr:1-acyl-sn-glycerol-3-phosphate acyltransferase [Bacilli bacterium]